MSIDQDDDEIDVGDTGEIDDADGERVSVDPLALVLELVLAICKIAASPKAAEAALNKIRRAARAAATAEQRSVVAEAQAEQTNAALSERVAALDARAAELDAQAADLSRRETEFENSLQEARDNLRGYYDSVTDADRRIRYRILSHADLLVGFNERLQTLPDWPAIRQMVPGLPDDPPSAEREGLAPPFRIDALADTFSDPTSDRHGTQFLGTLTRDVSHKGARHEN
jgi:hypothetical protein